MAYDGSKFIIDKEEMKPGLILFRRADAAALRAALAAHEGMRRAILRALEVPDH